MLAISSSVHSSKLYRRAVSLSMGDCSSSSKCRSLKSCFIYHAVLLFPNIIDIELGNLLSCYHYQREYRRSQTGWGCIMVLYILVTYNEQLVLIQLYTY
jgi:hypothetical protein